MNPKFISLAPIISWDTSDIYTQMLIIYFSSVQFSHSVVSDSLRPQEAQHARPPCHHQLPEFTQTHDH